MKKSVPKAENEGLRTNTSSMAGKCSPPAKGIFLDVVCAVLDWAEVGHGEAFPEVYNIGTWAKLSHSRRRSPSVVEGLMARGGMRSDGLKCMLNWLYALQ
jgi:hypothetical protein